MVTRFVLSLRKTHVDQLNSAMVLATGDFTGTIQFRQEPEWTSFSIQPRREAERKQHETDSYELDTVEN
jgi:hypothetical protein